MAIHGFRVEDRFEATVRDILGRLGVTLTTGTDFQEFERYIAQARPDHPIGDPFDPAQHKMSADKACWIVGHDADGQLMHLHALRVLDTQNMTVADYFRRNFHGYSPPELEIDFDRSRYRACPDAKRMRGRVVYSGEVWVGGAPGQYRGTGLISYLMRYAMLTAMTKLSAEYMLGFIAKPQAVKGSSFRFGYMHVDPLALRWYMKGKPDPLEGVMAYMSEEDMRYIMDLPVSELEALAA